MPSRSNESTLSSLQALIDIVCSILNKPVSVIQHAGKNREGAQARALIAYFVKAPLHVTLEEFASFVSRDIWERLQKISR